MKIYQYMMDIYNNKTTRKCWRYSMMIEENQSTTQNAIYNGFPNNISGINVSIQVIINVKTKWPTFEYTNSFTF